MKYMLDINRNNFKTYSLILKPKKGIALKVSTFLDKGQIAYAGYCVR